MPVGNEVKDEIDQEPWTISSGRSNNFTRSNNIPQQSSTQELSGVEKCLLDFLKGLCFRICIFIFVLIVSLFIYLFKTLV